MENNNENVNTNKNNMKILFDETVKEVPILKMDSTTIIASKRNTFKVMKHM